MNRFSYTLLYYLLLPVVFLRLLWRARKAPLVLSFIDELSTTAIVAKIKDQD